MARFRNVCLNSTECTTSGLYVVNNTYTHMNRLCYSMEASYSYRPSRPAKFAADFIAYEQHYWAQPLTGTTMALCSLMQSHQKIWQALNYEYTVYKYLSVWFALPKCLYIRPATAALCTLTIHVFK